jgi:hypothetical protein
VIVSAQEILTIITITKDDPDGLTVTLNSASRLRACPGVRHFVVDSSRADNRVAAEASSSSAAVGYLWQEPAGRAAAFNAGLECATGSWVWFLNGGDSVHPKIEPDTLLSLLRESNADMMIFQLQRFPSGLRQGHPAMKSLWPPAYCWIPHPSTIMRRTVFDRHGSFDERYHIAMDFDLWLRITSQDVVTDLISIPLTIYDETGISNSNRRATARESVAVLRSHLWGLLLQSAKNVKRIFEALVAYYRESRT